MTWQSAESISNEGVPDQWAELITNQNNKQVVKMWTKPILCRLCECPASDGGVRVDQLDVEKLSEWWCSKIGAEYEPGHEEVICQFCLWDARLEHENAIDQSNECNWWTGHDDNQFFYKFYHQDEVIRCCYLELFTDANKKISKSHESPDAGNEISPVILEEHQFSNSNFSLPRKNETQKSTRGDKKIKKKTISSNSKKPIGCFLCAKILSGQLNVAKHMHKYHEGQFVECKLDGRCTRVFRTKQEKNEHVLKDHKTFIKCEFCHIWHRPNSAYLHMRTHHKNLIRCSYLSCRTYFHSEEEKLKHEELIHTSGHKIKCVFCNLCVSKTGYKRHLRRLHQSQMLGAFKCTFNRCTVRYFLTESERTTHIDTVHKLDLTCIYCDKVSLNKHSLQTHVNECHSDIKISCSYFGCWKFFHTRLECDAHMQQMHKTDEEKKIFRCPKCDYRSALRWSLKSHLAQVHGTTNNQCPKCGKFFASILVLKVHLKRHDKEAKLCQYCNQKVLELKLHQGKSNCKNCQEVLLCRRSVMLHKKICKV